jgi:hypothetical protein
MLAQGYSMSSFEQAMPMVLSKGGSAVINDHLSYLSKIPTWSDWDYPDMGFRESLKQELKIFKHSHGRLLGIKQLSIYHRGVGEICG